MLYVNCGEQAAAGSSSHCFLAAVLAKDDVFVKMQQKMFQWGGELVWMLVRNRSATETALGNAFLEVESTGCLHGGTRLVACSTHAWDHCFFWFSLYPSKPRAAAGRLLGQENPRFSINQGRK